jgi:hypothetical protein
MSFTPKYLSQRDPQWINEKLGFDDTLTIGTDGSALACLSMLVNGYGYNETPSSMNSKLKDMGSGIGFLGSLIVWPGLTRAFPRIVFRRIVVCRSQPAPLDEINASLDAGQALLVEIDRSPSPGLQNHWVVLYARQEDDYLMLDPWPQPPDNAPTSLVRRYGLARHPGEFITTVAWYTVVDSPAAAPVQPPGAGRYVRVQAVVTAGLRLLSKPETSAKIIAVETPGTLLLCLEPEAVAAPKIGVINQWLKVRDPAGLEGFVVARNVDQVVSAAPTPAPALQSTPAPSTASVPAPAPAQALPATPESAPPPAAPAAPEALTVLVSQCVGPAGLHLRERPDGNSDSLTILSAGVELTSLEPADQALPKIGQAGQWLNVRDGSGTSGYVAAEYVESRDMPVAAPAPQLLTVLVSSQASGGLNLRDRPSENGSIREILMPGTLLTVLEPAVTAQAKIGVVNQWLNVKLPGGMTGYVAAWYVTT